MLTREDNEILTQVGPGTPMGELMRRYWVPVVLSSELEAGAGPSGSGYWARAWWRSGPAGRSRPVGRVLLPPAVSLFKNPRVEETVIRCVTTVEITGSTDALPGNAHEARKNDFQSTR